MAGIPFGRPLLWALALLTFSVPVAWAQGGDMRLLLDRVERLQRELSTLQRHVYRGGAASAAPVPAPAQLGGADPRVAAHLQVKITQLEDELRAITGRIEELQHATRQITQRLEKLVGDVDFRLTALERAVKENGEGRGSPAGGAPTAAAAPDQRPSSAPVLSPRPGVLAEVPARPRPQGGAGAAAAGTPTGTGGASGNTTPGQQYTRAIGLMKTEKFSDAERALRGFIDAHPKDALVPNAYYWLGESYYARKDYQRAAFTFAEGFQKFPSGSKAADNLLKLGMALGKLGKKKEACTTFARLKENFPRATATVKRRTAQQQRANDCS